MTVPRDVVWALAASWALGLVMLLTAGIYDGPLAEPSLVVVLAVVGVVGWRFVRHLAPREERGVAARPALAVAGVAIGAFVVMAIADRRLLTDATSGTGALHLVQGATLLAVLAYLPAAIAGKVEGRATRDARFFAIVALVVGAGISVVRISPAPHIDVWSIHTTGALALAHGHDPYEVVSVADTGPYGEPLSFVYPPGTLYACFVGRVLLGDVRYAMLAALVGTGLALRAIARTGVGGGGESRPSLLEDAPALLVWLTPKALFFLEQSWNDVLPLAFTALAVLARLRERRLLAGAMLGVALACKQSMFWVIPLACLLQLGLASWATMAAVGAVIVVPFAAWDFRALLHANVQYHAHLPPRFDGLTPMNFLYRHFGVTPRSAPGFLLATATTVAAFARAPRTATSFALSATLAFLVFFVFNKWAFMNYYFFLAGLAALAAATAVSRDRAR